MNMRTIAEIASEIHAIQKVKFLNLGNDERLAEANAKRDVEMVLETYTQNLVFDKVGAYAILCEDLEDVIKAARQRGEL